MIHVDVLIPGDPDSMTGGYQYDRRLIAGLRQRGHRVDAHRLHDDFPNPGAAALQHAGQVLEAIPDGRLVIVDGLALGAMPTVIGRHASRLRLVALIHHPLFDEAGLNAENADRLRSDEAAALACARLVLVTSQHTADELQASLGVPANRIRVAPPGTDQPANRASADLNVVAESILPSAPRPSLSSSPLSSPPSLSPSLPPPPSLRLLCVATLTARKNHRDLLLALARQARHGWHLDCVGDPTRDPATTAALKRLIDQLSLTDRVTLHGVVPTHRLNELYARSDGFVLASRHEGYGMAFAEALASGLPIIATRAGATAQTVGEHAALLVPPDDVEALAAAIEQFLTQPSLRARLAAAARERGRQLPSWADTVATIEQSLIALETAAA